MDIELLKWMAACPIADSYRAHPGIVAEIEECGMVASMELGVMIPVPNRATIAEVSQLFSAPKTLGGKPLVVDAKTNPHTLQIMSNRHITPVIAIELKRGI